MKYIIIISAIYGILLGFTNLVRNATTPDMPPDPFKLKSHVNSTIPAILGIILLIIWIGIYY